MLFCIRSGCHSFPVCGCRPPDPPRLSLAAMQARSGCPWALLGLMVWLQAASVANAQDCPPNQVPVFSDYGVSCVPGELSCRDKTVPWMRGMGAAGGVAVA